MLKRSYIRAFVRFAMLTATLLGLFGTTEAQTLSPNSGSQRTDTFRFPAQSTVFPEGVAKDPRGNFFYVSATADGTIYRGDVRQPNRGLSVFLPGGADGRTIAVGMKVDDRGFLWVCGGPTGNIWLYDTRNGRLLSQFNNGVSNTFINDVTITPDGAAYFTDSSTPTIYRVAPNAQGLWTFEYWRDLRGTAIHYEQGFNLNGIVSSADGTYLVVVQSNTGQLFRITTDTKDISEIPLTGGDLVTNGDGLLLDGSTLYVSRNSLNLIVQLRLALDLSSGQQIGSFTDSSFRYTTTIARSGDRLLVVNSQFDKQGLGLQPELPFTVSSVPLPTVR